MNTRGWLGAAAVGLFATAVIAVASYPTGAATVAAVVPDGARVAARQPVGSARVLLVSDSGRLRVLVAYPGPKGWLRVAAPPGPAQAAAAWVSTPGGRGVPALAAVYGRVSAPLGPEPVSVEVTWADGRRSRGPVAVDGSFLVARERPVRSRSLTVLGADRSTVLEVRGP